MLIKDFMTASYPCFEVGQALRSKDLNDLVSYLDRQDRLTRIYLLGSGIFYGFEKIKFLLGQLPTDEPFTLTFSKGAGVSSAGYLFVFDKEIDFNRAFDVKIRKSAFTCVDTDTEEIGAIEFLDSTRDKDLLALPEYGSPKAVLQQDDLKDLCFVLLWFEETLERKSCVNSCDGAGKDLRHSVRVLAMKETVLNGIWNQTGLSSAGGAESEQFPFVKRLHKSATLPLLDPLETLPAAPHPNLLSRLRIPGELYEAWTSLCAEAIGNSGGPGPVPLALAGVLAGAKTGSQIAQDLTALKDALAFPELKPHLQYLHDHLRDLEATFRELVETAPQSVLTVCPDESRFPKFIALGGLRPDPFGLANPDHCRMVLYRPELPDIGGDTLLKVAFLRSRLLFLLDPNNVQLPRPAAEVRITGSAMKSRPLSRQAIPFYYQNIPQARDAWSFELTRTKRQKGIPSYERADAIAPFEQQLDYELADHDFFRIEGHLGKPLAEGFAAVDRQRHEHNLPFELTAVKLGGTILLPVNHLPDKELANVLRQLIFNTFAEDHPGLEHCAGVPKGGTFVLVYSEFPNADQPIILGHIDTRFQFLTGQLANPQLSADLRAIYQKELDALGGVRISMIQQTTELRIVADFCLPYSSFNAPKVEYKFVQGEHPPVADCHELRREFTFDASGNATRVEIFFENRSSHAASYRWEFTDLAAPATVLQTLNTNDRAEIASIALPLTAVNLPRNIRVKLTAFPVIWQTGTPTDDAICDVVLDRPAPISDFEVEQLFHFDNDDEHLVDVWLQNRSQYHHGPLEWFLQIWSEQTENWVPVNAPGPPAPAMLQKSDGTPSGVDRAAQWYHFFNTDEVKRIRVTLLVRGDAGRTAQSDQVIELAPPVVLPDPEPPQPTEPPSPDFSEIRRILQSQNEGWRVRFENRSSHANNYLWTVKMLDVAGASEDEMSREEKQFVEIPNFNDDKSIQWEVRLYAAVDRDAERTDPFASQILRFCPTSARVINAGQPANRVIVQLPQNPVTAGFAVSVLPVGGKFRLDGKPLASAPPTVDQVVAITFGANSANPISLLTPGQHILTYFFEGCDAPEVSLPVLVEQQAPNPLPPAGGGGAVVVNPQPPVVVQPPVFVQPNPAVLAGAVANVVRPPAPASPQPAPLPVTKTARPTSKKAKTTAAPQNLVAALNRRRTAYRENCEAASDARLAATASFRRTMSFLLQPPGNLDAATKTFEELSKLLLASTARPGGASDAQYSTLLRNATWYFWDKMVAENPGALPEAAAAMLRALAPAMQKAGLDLSQIRADWDGQGLKASGNEVAIKAIEAIFG